MGKCAKCDHLRKAPVDPGMYACALTKMIVAPNEGCEEFALRKSKGE